jgi:hypothetical protein
VKFRTGYNPDPDGHRRTPFARLSARMKAQTLPASFSLLAFAPAIMDQGQTGSCTGHATAAAVSTALAAAGTPLAWVPSPKGIYTLGREIDLPDASTEITDDGAQPNQVMRGITEWGVRPMQAPTSDGRLSDCDTATINDKTKLDELEADAVTLLLGEYGIVTTGAQREEDFKVALAVARKPVTFAVAGGSAAFQGYTGGVLEALNAPLDHYIFAYGYETLPSGELVILGSNSWGIDGWGELGCFRIGSQGIAELDDMVVLDVKKGTA